jgi:hypothetical protein
MPHIDEAQLISMDTHVTRALAWLFIHPFNHDRSILSKILFAAWEANLDDLVTTHDVLLVPTRQQTVQVKELPNDASHHLLRGKGPISRTNVPVHLESDHESCCDSKALPDLGQVPVKEVVVAVQGIQNHDFFVESENAAENVKFYIVAAFHGKDSTGLARVDEETCNCAHCRSSCSRKLAVLMNLSSV